MDMPSKSNHLKYKKSKKNKKSKSPNSKKKNKTVLKQKIDCDKNIKFSKYSDVEFPKNNGDYIEPDKMYKSIEESHTPPLTKSTCINDSKIQMMTPKHDEKHALHLRKEEQR